MRLNKREKLAISAFRSILDAIESGESIVVTSAEQTAIKDTLGVDLYEVTRRKKDVESFVRSKDDFKILFRKPFSDWHEANMIMSHGYFPFQIKSEVPFPKYEELYGKFVKMNDLYHTVHQWGRNLADKNRGKLTPSFIPAEKIREILNSRYESNITTEASPSDDSC